MVTLPWHVYSIVIVAVSRGTYFMLMGQNLHTCQVLFDVPLDVQSTCVRCVLSTASAKYMCYGASVKYVLRYMQSTCEGCWPAARGKESSRWWGGGGGASTGSTFSDRLNLISYSPKHLSFTVISDGERALVVLICFIFNLTSFSKYIFTILTKKGAAHAQLLNMCFYSCCHLIVKRYFILLPTIVWKFWQLL